MMISRGCSGLPVRCGRAHVVAAPAFGAGVHVQDAPPGEVLQPADAERARAPRTPSSPGRPRRQPAQVHRRQRRQHVEVLAEGQVVQEGEQQHDVRPVVAVQPEVASRRAGRRRRTRQQAVDSQAQPRSGWRRLECEQRRVGQDVGHHQRRDPDQDQHALRRSDAAARDASPAGARCRRRWPPARWPRRCPSNAA